MKIKVQRVKFCETQLMKFFFKYSDPFNNISDDHIQI